VSFDLRGLLSCGLVRDYWGGGRGVDIKGDDAPPPQVLCAPPFKESFC
jgi:hypothetical protein